MIIQTDDSYLKIARRLDEYRTNKTQFLPVCAAPVKSSSAQTKYAKKFETPRSVFRTENAKEQNTPPSLVKKGRPPSTIMESQHESSPMGSENAAPIGSARASRVPVKKKSTTNTQTSIPAPTNPTTSNTKEPGLKHEKARSISPRKNPNLDRVGRKISVNLPPNVNLPTSVVRGKVRMIYPMLLDRSYPS